MHSMFWVFAYICSGCKLATQIAGIITWNVNPWDVRSHSGKIRLSDCSLSHSGKSKKNQHRTSRSGGKLLPKSQANFGAKELASYFSISRIQLWAKIPGWLRVAIWQDRYTTDKRPNFGMEHFRGFTRINHIHTNRAHDPRNFCANPVMFPEKSRILIRCSSDIFNYAQHDFAHPCTSSRMHSSFFFYFNIYRDIFSVSTLGSLHGRPCWVPWWQTWTLI